MMIARRVRDGFSRWLALAAIGAFLSFTMLPAALAQEQAGAGSRKVGGVKSGGRSGTSVGIGIGVIGGINLLNKLSQPSSKSTKRTKRTTYGSKKERESSGSTRSAKEDEGNSKKQDSEITADRKSGDGDKKDNAGQDDASKADAKTAGGKSGAEEASASKETPGSKTPVATGAIGSPAAGSAGVAATGAATAAAVAAENVEISSRTDIRAAQEHLKYMGYDVPELTGTLDLKTKIAIMQFQDSIGTDATGVLTGKELQLLSSKVSEMTAKAQ